MMYSAKATLKSEVAGSRLNWLWWILDPFFFHAGIYICSACCIWKVRTLFSVICIYWTESVELFQQDSNKECKGGEIL